MSPFSVSSCCRDSDSGSYRLAIAEPTYKVCYCSYSAVHDRSLLLHRRRAVQRYREREFHRDMRKRGPGPIDLFGVTEDALRQYTAIFDGEALEVDLEQGFVLWKVAPMEDSSLHQALRSMRAFVYTETGLYLRSEPASTIESPAECHAYPTSSDVEETVANSTDTEIQEQSQDSEARVSTEGYEPVDVPAASNNQEHENNGGAGQDALRTRRGAGGAIRSSKKTRGFYRPVISRYRCATCDYLTFYRSNLNMHMSAFQDHGPLQKSIKPLPW